VRGNGERENTESYLRCKVRGNGEREDTESKGRWRESGYRK
jgi:hypothetical protein